MIPAFKYVMFAFASPHRLNKILRLYSPVQTDWLYALNDAIVLISGRCHVGRKHANRPHAHGSSCRCHAGLKDVGYGYTGATTDTTQKSGQTPDKEVEINHVIVLSAATRKPIHLACCVPTTTDWPNRIVCYEPGVWPHTCCSSQQDTNLGPIDKPYLTELARDIPPLLDQREKNYHKRDLKPLLWDEIGEKLNVTGRFWINTNEIGYYLFHHHHVPEGLGVFPVPWSSRWNWSLHIFLGRPIFLCPFGLYCSACFGSLIPLFMCTGSDIPSYYYLSESNH